MLLYGKGILKFITFQSVNSVDVQATNGPLNQSLDFDDDSSEETSSQNPGQSSEEREEAPTTLTKKIRLVQSRSLATTTSIGHFRVVLCLFFKASLGAQPFI